METGSICSRCGATLPPDAGRCRACGEHKGIAVPFPVVTARLTATPLTVVQAGRDPKTRDHTVKVTAHEIRSEARLSEGGRVTLMVEGAGGVGRSGEPQLLKTLRMRLEQDGHQVSIQPGQDDAGEDALLSSGSNTFIVQAVTLPTAPDFWRDARISSAQTHVDTHRATDWLHDAIAKKAGRIPPEERRCILLALDARHTGILANPSILTQYLASHGDPSVQYGFASVWLVGPTTEQCVRIGNGEP